MLTYRPPRVVDCDCVRDRVNAHPDHVTHARDFDYVPLSGDLMSVADYESCVSLNVLYRRRVIGSRSVVPHSVRDYETFHLDPCSDPCHLVSHVVRAPYDVDSGRVDGVVVYCFCVCLLHQLQLEYWTSSLSHLH